MARSRHPSFDPVAGGFFLRLKRPSFWPDIPSLKRARPKLVLCSARPTLMRRCRRVTRGLLAPGPFAPSAMSADPPAKRVLAALGHFATSADPRVKRVLVALGHFVTNAPGGSRRRVVLVDHRPAVLFSMPSISGIPELACVAA